MPEEENNVVISSFPDAESINAGDKVTGLQAGENKNFSFSSILAWLVSAITAVFVPVSRTINDKALSSDISLTASDVGAINLSEKGIINGVASLDGSGKVPAAQLPTIPDSADDISYDGSISGLLSPNVQGAIDETVTEVRGKQQEILASGILKGDGAGGVSAAQAGADYQAPLTFDAAPTSGGSNPVASGGIYSYYNNHHNLYNQSTDVSAANTSIALSESMAGYSFLVVRGYAGGTAAQQRFVLTIPVLGLSETAWYPIATSVGAGGIRLSGSSTTLTFVGHTYTSLTVYQVYGKR